MGYWHRPCYTVIELETSVRGAGGGRLLASSRGIRGEIRHGVEGLASLSSSAHIILLVVSDRVPGISYLVRSVSGSARVAHVPYFEKSFHTHDSSLNTYGVRTWQRTDRAQPTDGGACEQASYLPAAPATCRVNQQGGE